MRAFSLVSVFFIGVVTNVLAAPVGEPTEDIANVPSETVEVNVFVPSIVKESDTVATPVENLPPRDVTAVEVQEDEGEVTEGEIDDDWELDLDNIDPLVTRAVSGADGTAYFTWRSARSFSVSYRIKDTAGDSHPVYIESLTYDNANRSKFVLRCNNNNGNGNTVNCPSKTYTHQQTLIAVAAHVCVNIQLGEDQCSQSNTIRNPYA